MNAQRISLRVIQSESRPINGQDALEGRADRLEQVVLGKIRDDGVVDFKKRAITLRARQGFRDHLRVRHVN